MKKRLGNRLSLTGRGFHSIGLKGLVFGLRRRADQKPHPVRFLHIGKNAGTEINRWMTQLNTVQGEFFFEKCSHSTKLADLKRSDAYFFSIRDPISRFVSGFYSRKRKGQPRLYLEWSKHERTAFEAFPHANDLAEALFQDGETGSMAAKAMLSIFHVNSRQCDWFTGRGFFLEHRPPVWIIRQNAFEYDMDQLLLRLGLTPPMLGEETLRSHATNYEGIPPLSASAKENLRHWYWSDFEFVKLCTEWLENQGSARN